MRWLVGEPDHIFGRLEVSPVVGDAPSLCPSCPRARQLGIPVGREVGESGVCISRHGVQPGGDSEAFTADKFHEHHGFLVLSKTLQKKAMGHLSGREEGVKDIHT